MRARLLALVLLAACGTDSTPGGPGAPGPLPGYGYHVQLASLFAFTYTAGFYTGDGQQPFAMIIDTGSTSTGVAGAQCTTCGISPLYTPGADATNDHMMASTQYADGSAWSGNIFKDHTSLFQVPAVDIDLVAITSQNGFFDPTEAYQGILGLGPNQLLETGTTSYMDKLHAAGAPQTMAFRLCPDLGDMWIGAQVMPPAGDRMKFTPMLPIDDFNNPFYSVEISDVAFDGQPLGLTTASFGPTLVDTGTSISFVPTQVENMMLAKINGNAAFKQLFPGKVLADTFSGSCVTNTAVTTEMIDSMLPMFTITFPEVGGGTFSIDIPPSMSYFQPVGMGQFCWVFSSSGNNAAVDGSLIGDSLLVGMLAMFDADNKQLGFAPGAGCTPFSSARVAPQQSPFFRPPPLRPAQKR